MSFTKKSETPEFIQKKIEKLQQQLSGGHTHFWGPTYTPSEWKCECGKIRISGEEFKRRKEEWDSYYELVKTTPSYRDFWEMKRASDAKDLDKVAEIKKRVEPRCWVKPDYQGLIDEKKYEFDEDQYLPKPSFPDPEGEVWRYFISN